MTTPSPIHHLDPGPRYSEAVVHAGVVYLSGQVPEDLEADAQGQTREVLEIAERVLQRAGSGRHLILRAQVILPDLADYDAMNLAWEAFFQGVAAPPRVTFQAALAHPKWKIEVVLTAAVG